MASGGRWLVAYQLGPYASRLLTISSGGAVTANRALPGRAYPALTGGAPALLAWRSGTQIRGAVHAQLVGPRANDIGQAIELQSDTAPDAVSVDNIRATSDRSGFIVSWRSGTYPATLNYRSVSPDARTARALHSHLLAPRPTFPVSNTPTPMAFLTRGSQTAILVLSDPRSGQSHPITTVRPLG